MVFPFFEFFFGLIPLKACGTRISENSVSTAELSGTARKFTPPRNTFWQLYVSLRQEQGKKKRGETGLDRFKIVSAAPTTTHDDQSYGILSASTIYKPLQNIFPL